MGLHPGRTAVEACSSPAAGFEVAPRAKRGI